MSNIRVNLNDQVRVRLTEKGRNILRQRVQGWVPPAEDEQGWSTWQFWNLMQDFGRHMVIGFDPPFETDIEIVRAPMNQSDSINRQTEAAAAVFKAVTELNAAIQEAGRAQMKVEISTYHERCVGFRFERPILRADVMAPVSVP